MSSNGDHNKCNITMPHFINFQVEYLNMVQTLLGLTQILLSQYLQDIYSMRHVDVLQAHHIG